MTTYLITGGAGFVGSNLAATLVARQEKVRIFDDFSTGSYTNLATFADQIEIIEGDVRSYHLVQAAMEGVDFVLHQAALASVPRSVRDPITTEAVNTIGTLNVLHAAKKAGVKRVIFASSCALYGDNEVLPKHEAMFPEPLSPYAVSKLAGEHYCEVFWRLYNLETVSLRYFNVYGPHQDPASQYSAVIPLFISAILRDQPLILHGDGTQSRDFVFVADVVQANLLACVAPDAAGKCFNIAQGRRYSLLDLIKYLSQVTAKQPSVHHIARRVGDVHHSQADIIRATDVLDYYPQKSLQEGLAQTVQWFRQAL